MRSPSCNWLHLRGVCVVLLSACLPAAVIAAEPPPAGLGAEWVAIDPALLDDMRGGFLTPGGMALSFGIERAVFVNGELLATTRVHIPDVARMSAAQAQDLAGFNEGLVVQVGPGNTFEPVPNFNGLVIQNTASGQALSAVTTVNVGVDTLGRFQDLNTQAALQSALVAATSP